jgi:hypothetical protein
MGKAQGGLNSKIKKINMINKTRGSNVSKIIKQGNALGRQGVRKFHKT